MTTLATTKMSSEGQVVIPEDIRKKLNLTTGVQFLVVVDKDAVILKAITTPSLDEFDALISNARKSARQAGMKKSDIREAIARARGKE